MAVVLAAFLVCSQLFVCFFFLLQPSCDLSSLSSFSSSASSSSSALSCFSVHIPPSAVQGDVAEED